MSDTVTNEAVVKTFISGRSTHIGDDSFEISWRDAHNPDEMTVGDFST